MGWDTHQQKEFIRKWGEQWTRFVTTESWAQTGREAIDPILLESWLGIRQPVSHPARIDVEDLGRICRG